MSSARLSKSDAIVKLINQFRKSPCLWNPLNIYYHNKSARQDAYDTLLSIWRQFDPYMTLTLLKKKLEHLRAAYRRERRKVESSVDDPNGPYTPSLWYYEHMSFLSGKKEADSGSHSDSDSDEDGKTIYVHMPRKRRASQSELDESAEAFGISVGAQLHHLNKIQRYIAEKLISEVIYYGKMEKLSMNSSINVNTASQAQYDNNDIVIPKSAPSWYDTVEENGIEQESSSSCTFITNEEENKNEKENAVNFLKFERDVSDNVPQHDLVEKIDIVKEELVKP